MTEPRVCTDTFCAARRPHLWHGPYRTETTMPADLRDTTYAQRTILAALIRIGGSAKAADVAYEASHSPAYVTPMLDNLTNLGLVTRSNDRPFPTYSTELATASITPGT